MGLLARPTGGTVIGLHQQESAFFPFEFEPEPLCAFIRLAHTRMKACFEILCTGREKRSKFLACYLSILICAIKFGASHSRLPIAR